MIKVADLESTIYTERSASQDYGMMYLSLDLANIMLEQNVLLKFIAIYFTRYDRRFLKKQKILSDLGNVDIPTFLVSIEPTLFCLVTFSFTFYPFTA